MSKPADYEEIFPRPLSGAKVVNLPPALVPSRVSIKGQYVTLEPQEASKHAQDLYHASHGSEKALKIWDYLTYGPWTDVEWMLTRQRYVPNPQALILCFLQSVPTKAVAPVGKPASWIFTPRTV